MTVGVASDRRTVCVLSEQATAANGGSVMKVSRLVIALGAVSLALTACGGGSSTADSSPPPASPSAPASSAPSTSATANPSATGIAEGSDESAVAAMCDLMVSSDAATPPEPSPDDDAAGVNQAWADYFQAFTDYWKITKDEVDSLTEAAPNGMKGPAGDTNIALQTMNLAALEGVGLSLDGTPPTAAEIEKVFDKFVPEMDKACPQWVGQDWPYVGTPTPVPAQEPVAAAPKFRKLSERQWAKIAKNPDAYVDDQIIIYGHITQFDSATGTDTFRANVSNRRQGDWYDYETNTILIGDEDRLADFVEDDLFVAKAYVNGSFSYETQIGGETTVPLLEISSIKRIGSAT